MANEEKTITTAKAFKSGKTSLVIILPKELVKKYHIKEGTKYCGVYRNWEADHKKC